MKLFYPNHIFGTTTFSNTSNEVATLPISNVKNIHKEKPWRTSTSGALTLKLSKSAAQAWQFFADIRRTSYSPTSFAYGVGSTPTATINYASMTTQGNIDYYEHSSEVSGIDYYEYTFTAGSGGGDDTGILFASPMVSLTDEPNQNYQPTLVDKSAQGESLSGQIFAEVGPQFKRYRISWDNATDATRQEIEALYNSVGLHTPFFTQIGTVSPYNDYLYVMLKSPPRISSAGFKLWNIDVEFQDA